MRRGFRNVLVVAFALTGVVAWAGTRASLTVQTDAVDKLVRSTACEVSAYHVVAGAKATMTIQNDGGWCWLDTYERTNWHTLSAVSVAVTNPPRHGRVVVRDIANQEIRIAYQPEPGFGGQDGFSIRYESDGSDKGFVVAVLKPATTPAPAGPAVIAGRTFDNWAYLGTGRSHLNNVSEHTW
jgi:hypothetical protein